MSKQEELYEEYIGYIAFSLIGGLVFGIAGGLVFGIAGGLAFSLIGGLVLSLIGGLVFSIEEGIAGLVFGIAGGLAFGIVVGLAVILINFKEALPFINTIQEFIFVILGIIILSEILFFLTKEEKLNKNINLFWYTCKRKCESIFKVLIGLSVITQIYIIFREIKINDYLPEILKWIGYIGFGIIILGVIILVFYIWIKLNTLKYRK